MRITLASALVAVTATTAHAAADKACWYGVDFPLKWQVPITGNVDVPVYINTSATHGIQWSGYDSYDYMFSVWAAIGRWNEQSGARVRLRYAGTVDMGELDLIPSIPRGVFLYGVYPFDAGGQVWCHGEQGAALPLDPNDDNLIDYAWIAIPGANNSCSAVTLDPALLTDILTHEFGHALGRNDAYETSCGVNHRTIMNLPFADLSLFDALETQSVYGRRTTGSTRRRILNSSGGAWTAATTLDSTARMTRPGPATSVRNGPLQMAWRETTTSGVMRMARRMVSTSTLGGITTENVQAASPISIAHAPDATALMAYAKEPPEAFMESQVCWRISWNSGTTWGTETCSGDADYNGIGLAYDPLSKMFALGYTDYLGRIVLKSLSTTQSLHQPRTTTFTGRKGAQGVSIACADTVVSGNGNCRVVYANADEYGQPIAWFPTSIGFLGFSAGTVYTTSLNSQHVPAVAWFHNRFHLVYSYIDQNLYHYDMLRTGTSWTYRTTPATGSGTSWLSPPHLAPTTECSGDICATRLQLIWLQYQ